MIPWGLLALHQMLRGWVQSLLSTDGCVVHNTATPRENVGEVFFYLPLKKAGLLTELNAFTRSSETSTQSGWSLRRFLTPCTTFSAPPGIPTPNWTGEKKPGSFSLRLHMTAELMSLWKMVPIAMGLTPPSFLAIGISLAPKKYGLRIGSGMNSGFAAILLHSLQMPLSSSA